MNFKIRDWVLPITLFMAMVIDGMLSAHLTAIVTSKQFVVPVNLLLVGFVILNLVYDDNFNHFYLALVIGLFADWYYYGFIGMNLVFLPLMTLLIRYIAKAIPATFSARILVLLAVDFIWNIYMFIILNFFGIARIGLKSFLLQGLIPSLFSIAILYALTYRLWVNLVIEYPFFRK